MTTDSTPAQSLSEVLESARRRGADATALRILRRRHQHPQFPNRVRDLCAFHAAAEALVAESITPSAAEARTPPIVYDSSASTHSTAPAGPAERLFRAGFEVIPIIPPGAPLSPNSEVKPENAGKIPGVKGVNGWHGLDWRRHQTSIEDTRKWDADSGGVGIRCGLVIGVDLDILDEDLSTAIRELAFIHL